MAQKCPHCGAPVSVYDRVNAQNNERTEYQGERRPNPRLSFSQAVNICWKKYADFSGRARRSEYWWFGVFNVLAIIVISFVAGFIAGAMGTSDEGMLVLVYVLVGLYCLVVLLPGLAVTVRRLHDTGRSGWWYLICLVPYVGSLVLLVFTCLDSKPEENRWGPSPKYS